MGRPAQPGRAINDQQSENQQSEIDNRPSSMALIFNVSAYRISPSLVQDYRLLRGAYQA
jgi:hypothetical protein